MNGCPTSREIQLRWWLRKRVDSPSPICTDTRSSFLWGTFPGTPIQIGRSVPRRRTSAIQAAMVAASKQSWLTMWVAIARLGEHRPDRLLVADQVVALRVAGDPDRLELGPARPHRLEQLRRAGELAGRLRGVAGEHEQLAHSRRRAAGRAARDEMRAVAHQARREVRHRRGSRRAVSRSVNSKRRRRGPGAARR